MRAHAGRIEFAQAAEVDRLVHTSAGRRTFLAAQAAVLRAVAEREILHGCLFRGARSLVDVELLHVCVTGVALLGAGVVVARGLRAIGSTLIAGGLRTVAGVAAIACAAALAVRSCHRGGAVRLAFRGGLLGQSCLFVGHECSWLIDVDIERGTRLRTSACAAP